MAPEEVANRFIAGVPQALAPARSFPQSGAPRSHLAPGLRVLLHGDYAIYYLPKLDVIAVIRVLHGSRDVAAIAGRGGFPEGG